MIVAFVAQKGPVVTFDKSHDTRRIHPPSEVNMQRFSPSRWLPFALAVVAFTLLRAPVAHAQAATLTGRVMSESGQPVENANVFITEMNISIGTNAQGRYTMVIPSERVRGQSVVLRVRAIAHLAQARPVTIRAGAQTIDFE